MRTDHDERSTATEHAAGPSSSPGGSGWVRVCANADLAPNTPLRVVIGNNAIVIVRGTDGVVHALDDTCTHGQVSLSEGFVEGNELECWAHGATFDLETGAALTLPATKPLRVYPVAINDEDIVILSAGRFADGSDVDGNGVK